MGSQQSTIDEKRRKSLSNSNKHLNKNGFSSNHQIGGVHQRNSNSTSNLYQPNPLEHTSAANNNANSSTFSQSIAIPISNQFKQNSSSVSASSVPRNSSYKLIKLTHRHDLLTSSSLHNQVINFKSKINFPSEQERNLYKNSSKIKHDFGPTIAPLTSKKDLEKKKKIIPIILTWTQGGENVNITGTFNNWKQKIKMKKSAQDFSTIIDLEPGTHRIKFIVDDEWKCSDDLPIATDSDGNLVNLIFISDETGNGLGDGFDNCESGEFPQEPEVEIEYNNEIPAYLLKSDQERNYEEDLNLNQAKTDLVEDKINQLPTEPPPLLPKYCEKVLLNTVQESKLDLLKLPIPNHVTLNHLYACSIKDGVMALACTSRYRKKFVTTILYKSVFD
ncbi:hypothetical protein HDU92_005899 [Lobulomyces angularis]|nr:hypothetical protein HDU92_005899 [Lobulomyces angularis]